MRWLHCVGQEGLLWDQKKLLWERKQADGHAGVAEWGGAGRGRGGQYLLHRISKHRLESKHGLRDTMLVRNLLEAQGGCACHGEGRMHRRAKWRMHHRR